MTADQKTKIAAYREVVERINWLGKTEGYLKAKCELADSMHDHMYNVPRKPCLHKTPSGIVDIATHVPDLLYEMSFEIANCYVWIRTCQEKLEAEALRLAADLDLSFGSTLWHRFLFDTETGQNPSGTAEKRAERQ